MVNRTESRWYVVGAICDYLMQRQYSFTLQDLARTSGIPYSTVWHTVDALEKINCIKVQRYRDEVNEGGIMQPHAKVSVWGHARSIWQIYWWLDQKFSH